MLRPSLALAFVAIGAAVISVTAMFVHLVALGPAALGAYRCGFAVLALGAWILVRPRSRVVDPLAGPSVRAVVYAVGAGACFAADLYVWHLSIPLAGTGFATLLANTQVFWVAGFSALALKERLHPRLLVCAVLALVGIALLANPGTVPGTLRLRGIALGLATGVFYAGYYLCLRASQREVRRLTLTGNLAVTCVVSMVLLLGVAVATGESLVLSGLREAGLLCILGSVVHVGGWVAISKGMTAIPAASGALLLLLQPILATLWGVLWFTEPFGGREALGTALSLVAIYAAMVAPTPRPAAA